MLLPALQAKISQEWFDPKQFKDSQDIDRAISQAYVVNYTERMAAQWIIEFLKRAEIETLALEKKEKGEVEVDPFAIGREGTQ